MPDQPDQPIQAALRRAGHPSASFRGFFFGKTRFVVVPLMMLAVVATAGSAMGLGCGYSVATKVDHGATSPSSVAISPFKNATDPYVPGAEITLHAAILDSVMGRYTLRDVDDADLIVTGEIMRFRQAILSQRTDLEPSEISVTVQVRVHMRQRRPVVREWSETLQPTTEAFALDGGETLDETASRAFRSLAQDIVLKFAPPTERWGGRR